ncbi:MAG: glutathione S-transferase family protein [Gammaproteobacteria bacterium]|nr:glutathione S-transferase family protein [Gammaproteobacteria bacterium]
MKIYHVKGTRSIRVIWLCHELNLPLAIETIPNFDATFKASPEWRAKSPTGKVPVLEDGAITMFESGAMVEYILGRYGPAGLVPSDPNDLALYYQWCWFAEATFARPLGDIVHNTVIKPPAERIAAVVPDAKQRARACLDGIDRCVENQPYLLGDLFSAADIMMGYSLMLAERTGVLTADHPNSQRYFGLLSERDGFKAAREA